MRSRSNLNLATTVLAFGALGLIACEDPNEARAEREFTEYSDFVENESGTFDNADDWEWNEYESNWNEYETAYEEHERGVEENIDYLSDKNRTEFERMQSEYEDRRMRYEERASEERVDENSISGGMYSAVNISNPNNVNFSNVNANNLRRTYKNFVDYVDNHKEEMTATDWRNAERVWERLNVRKNEVEENISTEDNVAIGTIKVEYGALKSSYGFVEDIGDTTERKRDLGDETDRMEERSNSPNN